MSSFIVFIISCFLINYQQINKHRMRQAGYKLAIIECYTFLIIKNALGNFPSAETPYKKSCSKFL